MQASCCLSNRTFCFSKSKGFRSFLDLFNREYIHPVFLWDRTFVLCLKTMDPAATNRYNLRGVSSDKEDVHAAIKNVDKGLFPKAFCKILPDYLSGDEEYCMIMHADGAGTKSILAYAYWKETGDLSVWRGIAQDSLIMNVDDLLCVGAVNNFMLSSTINRNKALVPGEVISAIINGTEDLLKSLKGFGVSKYNILAFSLT